MSQISENISERNKVIILKSLLFQNGFYILKYGKRFYVMIEIISEVKKHNLHLSLSINFPEHSVAKAIFIENTLTLPVSSLQ